MYLRLGDSPVLVVLYEMAFRPLLAGRDATGCAVPMAVAKTQSASGMELLSMEGMHFFLTLRSSLNQRGNQAFLASPMARFAESGIGSDPILPIRAS